MADDTEKADEGGTEEADAGQSTTAAASTADVTERRIRTLAIFFLGIGVYACVGAGLDAGTLLLDNLTTYFVSGIVVLAVGLVLLVLTR